MRIILISTTLQMGGAERLVLNLADFMSAQGHDVHIVSLTGEIILFPTHPQIKITALQMSKTPMGFIRAYFALRGLIKEFEPDIIHSHMVHANLLARLLRLSTSMQCLICTAHNAYEGGFLRMLGYRLTHKLADITTNVSLEAVKAFEQKGATPVGQMITVHNGINCKTFYPDEQLRTQFRQRWSIPPEVKLYVAVGRLVDAKDYPNLLKAFSQIAIKQPQAVLWIVGDGPLRKQLEGLVDDYKLNAKVRFLGLRYDVPNLLRVADIFVLSSAWEGFGLVVGEAMATCKTVVATDCGGVSELIGDCGYLVPPHNSQKLADAMLNASKLSTEEFHKLGKNARQRVIDHFSLEKFCSRWLEIYTSAI